MHSSFSHVLCEDFIVLHRMFESESFERRLSTTSDSSSYVTSTPEYVDWQCCELSKLDVGEFTRCADVRIHSSELDVLTVNLCQAFIDIFDREFVNLTPAGSESFWVTDSAEYVHESCCPFAELNIDECAKIVLFGPRIFLDGDNTSVSCENTSFSLFERDSFRCHEPFRMTSSPADCIDERAPFAKFMIDERGVFLEIDVRRFDNGDGVAVCEAQTFFDCVNVHMDIVSYERDCN